MSVKTELFNLKKYAASVEWKLLAFLILFLNVKLAIKIPTILLMYLLQFDFRFGFKLKGSRLPLFYPAVILIAFINWVIYGGYTKNYNLVFSTGIGFWLLCILALHQVKLTVEKNEVTTLHNTVSLFFMLNAAVSVITLCSIISEIHVFNPYRYQGLYQKYFISTGDYIKGLTLDVSTTNAVLNAFGVIYFLIKGYTVQVLICMAVLLLTGSNTVNLALAGMLALLFIFNTTKYQKSRIVVCFALIVVFMARVSPQNNDYILKTYNKIVLKRAPEEHAVMPQAIRITGKPDSLCPPEEKKIKIAQHYLDSVYVINHKGKTLQAESVFTTINRPAIPVPSIHSLPFQHRDDSTAEQRNLVSFIHAHQNLLRRSAQPRVNALVPGKLIAMEQTLAYLHRHPQKIITGTGMGNFSSKLAFRATNLGVAGGFPAKYAYINIAFLTNHLDVYLNFFSRTAGLHSLLNTPGSVYDQLLSEYGLAGLYAFAILYAGYFLKHYRQLSYGLPLLLLTGGILMVDYWFEQLSVIVFFELLMLIDIKENSHYTVNNGNS